MAKDDKIRYEREMAQLTTPPTPPQSDRDRRPRRANRLGRPKSTRRPPALEPLSGDFEAEDQEMERAINGWSPEAVKVPAMKEYSEMVDKNKYYVEETAWRYHNPPLPSTGGLEDNEREKPGKLVMVSVGPEELRPLPPPPEPPEDFPNTKYCRWSYDSDTRVLLADFRPIEKDGELVITLEDEEFLLKMYERDDITVVSDGLFSGLDPDKWTLDYIRRVAGDQYYHRFRRFDIVKEEEAKGKKKPPRKPYGSKNSDDASKEIADPSGATKSPSEPSSCDELKEEDYVEVRHVEVDR